MFDVTHRPHTMVILALLCLLFNFTMLLKKLQITSQQRCF